MAKGRVNRRPVFLEPPAPCFDQGDSGETSGLGAQHARAVDQAAVEGVANFASEHLEQMLAAGILAGEGELDFGGIKQNNIHRFKGSLRYHGPVVLSETLFE